MTTASICTIGDEILIGQIVDTNSSHISTALNSIGIQVRRMLSIGDSYREIIDSLERELSENQIVIVTGGLGPTKDDVIPEGQEEKFPAITASDYNVTYEIVKDHAETSFYGASGSFGTLLGLRYYYNVSLTAGTITKVGVIVTDAPLSSPSGKFTDNDKLINAEKSNNSNATYMSTITGLNVNELDDKYATIYVEYTDAEGETQYVYGDTMVYGLE